MMIARQSDAVFINRVLNDAEVRPTIADMSEGKIDITPIIRNQNNIVLAGEYGGVVLLYLMEGFYEVHTAFLPEGRGKWGMEFLRHGMRMMFTCTGCIDISTRVPEEHPGAKQAALMAGMTWEFTASCVFTGRMMPCEVYSIGITHWASRVDGMVERGQWLHHRLKQEAARLGITEPTHEDDDTHNRYAGICYEMCVNGQARKGVAFYSRWALIARHRPVILVSEKPPVIKFDIGLMRLKEDGDIEVVPSC